ncbi:putative disease resistance protein RGA3 [Hordeum vulgare subsp. vulgare]|uniref:Protein kinase domain-containing protein n=1 Tax=Hordeum vulgare subsp. vulgare TaxID=112509 RepID=A0A8I7BDI9_HORVV|nr:putative disease resistance protein RGA3 [Hordeum vulgare subsp. vulgare]XP_044949620.1 putative disease resistance protein RGA3 [Hordeum vulgare subsp. vulgare]
MTAEKRIPLHELHEITNGFSLDSRIGKGGYGDVYKGVYKERDVAVKLLHVDMVHGIDDKEYINEVGNLLRVKHPNIVQLLGYSYETTSELVEHNGKQGFSKHIYRVLCFEYLEGGSLDKHLDEKSFAPDWSTRYMIIKGICEGLDFLHRCQPPIFHLDLKPANILLDRFMVPKVADFGLSRVISESHTQVTKQIKGTQAYMPPEFITDGYISRKNDVFSFGSVMIEIMTGSLGNSGDIEMDEVVQFTQKVLSNWKNRIKATSEYPLEESHQVQICIDTAMRCMELDRNNRPTIAEILDILNKTETHIPKRQMADVLPRPTIGLKSKSDMLEMMVAELNNNEHGHCNSMPTDSSNGNVQQPPERETTSDVEEVIIGRTKEKHKILSNLSQSVTEEMVIFPIYGIGGIGKTTLAQLVFNDPQFRDYTRVWVYVSQEFNLNKIGNSIITELTGEISNISTKQMLHKCLNKLFADKSILIVLDDLWEEKAKEFDRLKTMLRLGGGGSKVIIVTTRDEAIARKLCSPAVTPYKLESLTVDECWTIIKQKAYFEDRTDQEQLEHIGREIATKCGGVALAAQSLGYILYGMSSDEWESVRDSYIWNLSTSEGHEVLASLRLSYMHMSPGLKLCFSYCAIFPKGHNILKYELIHQWIALRFTEKSGVFDPMQLCEKYVMQLLGMSFLQHSMTPLSDTQLDKDVTLFTMHDLVHDLARAILAHQINTEGNKCRYALLRDCSKSLQLSFPANIRALHFRDCGGQELYDGAFSSAKCLSVLDLSECFIKKLPDCIGQLKQLGFLHAPRIQYEMIPNCIAELSQLNYLNLRGSHKISALPESIGDMKALMHLDLSGCIGIRELPVSFAELKQLVHLDLSYCKISTAEAFGGFTKLQYLNLAGQTIIDLDRSGLSEVIGNLTKLKYLNLSSSMLCMALGKDQIDSLLGSISTLSNLEHLDLSHNIGFNSIPESIGNLMKLHTLDLTGWYSLKKLPGSMVQMVNLKVVRGVSLDELAISRFNCASLPHFEVHASSDKCSSNISLLHHKNPYELTIDKLENVKSPEEAHSIKLIEKQKIKELAFQWTLGAGRFVDDKDVLEKLVPPSSVQILSIKGYMNVSIPFWVTCITQYLPNLTKLDLCDFPNCNTLPPLGQLPNLQNLNLYRMEGLEEWTTTHNSAKGGSNELMFPMLQRLRIQKCARLRVKSCLPRTMYLYIEDCDTMLSSWGESSSHSGTSSSSPLTELNIAESKVPMYQWRLLHQLPSLRRLIITECSDLSTSSQIIDSLSSLRALYLESLSQAELPRWLVKLKSLQELTLSGCASMTLPGSLGGLTSLKILKIEDCEWISSLPDSIQQLTKLEHLTIRDCPTLEMWCESKENKWKLAHIKEVVPSSLMADPVECDLPSTTSKVHPEVVRMRGAVMNTPGFKKEALGVAASHLENTSHGFIYMEMNEEQQVLWLRNFLAEHYYNLTTGGWRHCD